jgi:hypothetical protein
VAKPKFNPQVLSDMSPSGGLPPLDFMRPLDEPTEPSTEASVAADQGNTSAKPKPKPVRQPRQEPQATDLPMPPSRKTEVRVQLNARVEPELMDRLRGFALAHRVDIQDVIGYSLDEFLKRRDG